MVVAIVALVVALGGTAVGAAFVTKKQTKKIAANQVNKLAPGLSVNHAKTADSAKDADTVKDGAVTTSKLANDAVTAPKLGPTADAVESPSIPATDDADVIVSCPAGQQAIAGGYFTPPTGDVIVTRMRRNSDSSWAFTFRNNDASAHGVDARVTCLI
jgi:tRNA(Arg) A34 adenosine deaminase TadA